MKTLYRDGVRHLMYCGPNGEREVHRYTRSEMLEIFGAAWVEIFDEIGAHTNDEVGIWIDLIFAGEKMLAEVLA